MISFEEIIPSVLFSAPFPEKRETQTQATAKIAQAYGSVVLWVHQMSPAITKTLKKKQDTHSEGATEFGSFSLPPCKEGCDLSSDWNKNDKGEGKKHAKKRSDQGSCLVVESY